MSKRDHQIFRPMMGREQIDELQRKMLKALSDTPAPADDGALKDFPRVTTTESAEP